MPTQASTFCRTKGCPNRVTSGKCPKCQQQSSRAYDRARGTAAERGYDTRWGKYRATFLDEHWYCGARPNNLPPTGDSECLKLGLWVKANVVDHIVPVTGPDDPRFYDETNHQAMCVSDHERKRQRESIQARKDYVVR